MFASVVGVVILGFLSLMVVLTIIGGWVLSVMWNWFIPVIFHGAPYLTVSQAIGVSLVVSAFMRPEKPRKEEWWIPVAEALLRLALLLLFGFIAHQYVA